MKVIIKDIAYYLPQRVVTNEELYKENPGWKTETLEERIGVMKRHVAGDGETALDLAYRACEEIISKNSELPKLIDGIIFCTQSGDHVMPSNACILHKMLKLSEEVIAFDFNLACSGYIYGLAIVQGLILSGMAKNILLVNADTYSKYIAKNDRSVRMLFGDGAAVSWISLSGSGSSIIDIICATAGQYFDKFIIPAGGCRMPKSGRTSELLTDESGNSRTLENIHMDGMGIFSFVNSRVPRQIKKILTHNRLNVTDIKLFVFHQASKMALDSLGCLLGINPEKVFKNLGEIGNTVSASIPIALKDALNSGKLSKGDKVLLSGFGVGLSWGAAIIEI
ncbi:MAG: ketoacyl-ACP synthase III [Candidatus Omnitrophota bacterium]